MLIHWSATVWFVHPFTPWTIIKIIIRVNTGRCKSISEVPNVCEQNNKGGPLWEHNTVYCIVLK